MKRALLLFLLSLVGAGAAFAQSPATVTGNLQTLSAGQISSGSVRFQLANIGTGNPPSVIGIGLFPRLVQVFTTDSTGAFSVSIWGNDNINPANTIYQVTFLDNLGNSIGPIQYSITGASVNLNTLGALNGTVPPVLAPSASLTGNNAFTGNNTFKNFNTQIFAGPAQPYTTIESGLLDTQCLTTLSCQLNLFSTFTESGISATITLGNGSTQAVHLRALPGANVSCNVTSGTSGCFLLNTMSSISGEVPGSFSGGTGGGFNFTFPSTLNATCFFCTPPTQVGGTSYVRAENFFLYGNITATLASCFDIAAVNNLPIFRDFYLYRCPAIGMNVRSISASGGVAGPMNFDNVWSDTFYATGGRPWVIQGQSNSILGINVFGGVANHPGAGLAMMEINGNSSGTAQLRGVNVVGTYYENLQGGNSIANKIRDANAVVFSGIPAVVRDTDTIFDISESGAGRTCGIQAHGIYQSSPTNGATMLNNHITGHTETGAVMPFYNYGGEAACSLVPFTIESNDVNIWDGANHKIYTLPKLGSPIFRNFLDAQNFFTFDSGLTAGQNASLHLSDRGTDQWSVDKDPSNNFDVFDRVNSKTRIFFGLSASPSASGALRLTNAEKIGWRNAANSGDDVVGEMQMKRVAGCATAASLNATCDTTVTWTSAFADANYTAVCTGDVVTSGIPIVQGIDISAAKTAAAITVRTISITAAAAQFTTLDCKAVHD